MVDIPTRELEPWPQPSHLVSATSRSLTPQTRYRHWHAPWFLVPAATNRLPSVALLRGSLFSATARTTITNSKGVFARLPATFTGGVAAAEMADDRAFNRHAGPQRGGRHRRNASGACALSSSRRRGGGG